jgi:alkylation response protein AidB-like acyl-CoA dehydrogenase
VQEYLLDEVEELADGPVRLLPLVQYDPRSFPPARETALAKRAASSVSVAAADHAIQMLGWHGVVRDADHPAERLLREIRGWTIAGGTNEALLNLLAGELLDR